MWNLHEWMESLNSPVKGKGSFTQPTIDDHTFWTIHPSVELTNVLNLHEGLWSLSEDDEPPLKLLAVPVSLFKLQKLSAPPPTCAPREDQGDSELTDTHTHTPLIEVQCISRSSQPILLAFSPELPCRQAPQEGGRQSRCLVCRWAQKYFLKLRKQGGFCSCPCWVSLTPVEWSLIWLLAIVMVTDDLIVAVFWSFCLRIGILFEATDCCLTPDLASLSPSVSLLLLVSAFWTTFQCANTKSTATVGQTAGW